MIKSAPGFSGLLGQVPQSHKVASHLSKIFSFKNIVGSLFSRRIKLDILPQIGTNLFLRKLFVNRTFSFRFQLSVRLLRMWQHTDTSRFPWFTLRLEMSTTPHPSQCLPLLLLNVYQSFFLMSTTPHPSQCQPQQKIDFKPMSGCDACRLHSLCRFLDWRAVAPQVRFAGN